MPDRGGGLGAGVSAPSDQRGSAGLRPECSAVRGRPPLRAVRARTCRTGPARLFCEAFYEKLPFDGRRHSESEGEPLNSWDIKALELRPHSPEILSTSDDARAIVLEIPAGEDLTDHQLHERAWVTVLDGEVEITTTAGEKVVGGCGLMVEFAPRKRHAVPRSRNCAPAAAAYVLAGARAPRSDAA